MTACLADQIAIRPRFARSASLERDLDQIEPLAGYRVTARALDAIDRIAAVAAEGPSGGAWSLTGPHGSGKSSIALLIGAAFGPDTPARRIAWDLITGASPRIGDLIRKALQRYQARDSGFYRGLVTAHRESFAQTILRGLHAAVKQWNDEMASVNDFAEAKTLESLFDDVASADSPGPEPSPTEILRIAKCLARSAPLLLVIDEFGKNIEAATNSQDADPYLLQQLAEAGQASGLPILILTLQHLAFEDYLRGSDGQDHREWAKVQGRFEDITYVESGSQTRALISTAFKVNDKDLGKRIREWSQAQAKTMRSLGILEFGRSAEVESCYPLHPLTAMVLPELCNRYGQHERTLFAFLTGPDSTSAATFLKNAENSLKQPLPSVGLDTAYDYFVAGSLARASGVNQPGRWVEIATRLRDVHGLSTGETRLAKAVAILNLVSASGPIRASRNLLHNVDSDAGHHLTSLEAKGILTYRDFADEYRVWHGSGLNILQLLQESRDQVRRRSLVDILTDNGNPRPIVVARHSAQYDVLRVFSRRFAFGNERVEPPTEPGPYDGEVLLVIQGLESVPRLSAVAPHAKPVVAVIPHCVSRLKKAGREAAAIAVVLRQPEVERDWVARRELGERLALAKTALERAVKDAFHGENSRWILLGADGNANLQSGRGTSALSDAADRVYSNTPFVGNEMLNRTDLTSQGVKARRILIEAMIERGSIKGMGLKGYGPEVAMYKAFLERTGVHQLNETHNCWQYGRPHHHRLLPAWASLVGEFERAKTHRINLREIYSVLLLPPIGMKAGPVPVLVIAALLAKKDEVAIYARGTFQPRLTVELAERIVRNPQLFEIKNFGSTTGTRADVLRELTAQLGARHLGHTQYRVSSVLSVAGHLVRQMSILDNYTRRTSRLDKRAKRVRDELFKAVEPDELLFNALPEALGFPRVSMDASSYPFASAYAQSLGQAVDELNGSLAKLLSELLELTLRTTGEKCPTTIQSQAGSLSPSALNAEIRPFILTLANDAVDSDLEWIKAVATVVTCKAPAEWSDQHLDLFQAELPHRLATFQRLFALRSEPGFEHECDRLRVTITGADGAEQVRLIGIDDKERAHTLATVAAAVADLARIVGSPERAQKAILAVLSERLLCGNGWQEVPFSLDSDELE